MAQPGLRKPEDMDLPCSNANRLENVDRNGAQYLGLDNMPMKYPPPELIIHSQPQTDSEF